MRTILGVFEVFLGIFEKTKEKKDRVRGYGLSGISNRCDCDFVIGASKAIPLAIYQGGTIWFPDDKLSQDAQPPLTPRQGLYYRGRVPDASP